MTTSIRYFNGNRFVLNQGLAFRYVTCQHGTGGWHGRYGEHTHRSARPAYRQEATS